MKFRLVTALDFPTPSPEVIMPFMLLPTLFYNISAAAIGSKYACVEHHKGAVILEGMVGGNSRRIPRNFL